METSAGGVCADIVGELRGKYDLGTVAVGGGSSDASVCVGGRFAYDVNAANGSRDRCRPKVGPVWLVDGLFPVPERIWLRRWAG
jgi:hypothetical protein